MFGQLEADVGGSLYVAGPPGTGKSLAMARLTAQLHDTTTTVVNFNCMVCPSLRSVALSHKATTHPPTPAAIALRFSLGSSRLRCEYYLRPES